MNIREKAIYKFANHHNLSHYETAVLPALFDKVAEKSQTKSNALVMLALRDKEFADYIINQAKFIADDAKFKKDVDLAMGKFETKH